MTNTCQFSPCRRYRYTLLHGATEISESTLCWIGLNPSTADEQQLDPTLRRVKAFTEREGYKSFAMLNVWPFRATDPKDMQAHYASTDLEIIRTTSFLNASHIRSAIRATGHRKVVCAWGVHAPLMPLSLGFLWSGEFHPLCLGTTAAGHPRHPLYIAGETPLVEYTGEENP